VVDYWVVNSKLKMKSAKLQLKIQNWMQDSLPESIAAF
jgi:hypothetical protein